MKPRITKIRVAGLDLPAVLVDSTKIENHNTIDVLCTYYCQNRLVKRRVVFKNIPGENFTKYVLRINPYIIVCDYVVIPEFDVLLEED